MIFHQRLRKHRSYGKPICCSYYKFIFERVEEYFNWTIKLNGVISGWGIKGNPGEIVTPRKNTPTGQPTLLTTLFSQQCMALRPLIRSFCQIFSYYSIMLTKRQRKWTCMEAWELTPSILSEHFGIIILSPTLDHSILS